jgi:ubiquinone/menaquinone biosynthesis C-methylase UbiE
VAAVFDQVADTYEAVGVPWFVPIAEGLVSRLAPSPGEQALDIGCGKGAATFALADAVGPEGHVTAIDLSAAMVDAARAEAVLRGVPSVEWHVMDAAAPQLPASHYDVIASSLVLFFLPDPPAAATAWTQLLRPGGRLGISTFGARDSRWQALDDVFTPYLPPQMLDARTSGESGPFSSDAGVEQLLSGSGLSAVSTSGFEVAVSFTDVEHWATWSRSHGQRAMWNAVPPEHQAEVMEHAGERLEACRTDDDSLVITQQIRVTTGIRP